MKRLHYLITTLLAVTVLLAACGGQSIGENAPALTEATNAPVEEANDTVADEGEAAATAEGYPVTVTDMLGRELTFDAPPERVVALNTTNYGAMASLGIRPVAHWTSDDQLTDSTYFFEDGESIMSVQAPDGNIDLELVAEAEPDLILAWNQEEVDQMSGIAPVFASEGASFEEDLEPTKEHLRKLGQVFGREAEAEATITSFEDSFAAYQQRVPEEKPSVVRVGVFDDGTVWPLVQDPLCTFVLNTVARCDYDVAFDGSVDVEALLTLDPDVIIFSNWERILSDEELLSVMEENPLWNELTAVQNDRVIIPENYTNPNLASIPDAEKFLDRLMPLIYPDIFDGPLTDDEVQEILVEQ
ncbi:MAG: ABC transporter substrate-binding protein [Chloroflexota bacterium]